MGQLISIRQLRLFAGVSMIACVAAPIGAAAQSAAPANAIEELIVTARKRDETAISVPVVITAVSGATLERRGVNSIDGLARLVPQLLTGDGSGGAQQGGVMVLRGISGSDSNPFGDQALSFNIDGVQVAHASIRRMGQTDISQVEVLKGPQALYFGKNSPAGIISIRTNDPTSQLAGQVSGGYETVAREWRGEGFVSGPLAENLGGRLSVFGADMRGWNKVGIPDGLINSPNKKHTPGSTEYALRGTLLYNPTDQFSARFKLGYNKIKGTASTSQVVDCPTGVPQLGGLDDCTADDVIYGGATDFGPNVKNLDPMFGDGRNFMRQNQTLGSLELNYKLTPELTVTSISGLYDFDWSQMANYVPTYTSALNGTLSFMGIRELSQEVRMTSSFSGPINFMFGGRYDDTRAYTRSDGFLNLAAPVYRLRFGLGMEGSGHSVFGQVLVDVLPTVQLSAGGRYSSESKHLTYVRQGLAPTWVVNPVVTPVTRASWDDFSPEVTGRWRPNDDLTIFVSYKEGFLSGGFNSGSTNFTQSLKYDQQTVSGFEGGIKAALLDHRLRANFSVYDYTVKGMQISTSINGIQQVFNAGRVGTKGAEVDFAYLTPVEGLSVNAAVAYNRARYEVYVVNCYRGQSQAAGCKPILVADPAAPGGFRQTGTEQNLAGAQVVRAPDWSASGGFTYEVPVSENLRLGLDGGLTYSGSYFANPTASPGSHVSAYILVDATVRLSSADDRWQLALIGRNLTDKYYFVRVTDGQGTGANPGTVAGGLLGDSLGAVSRGRELMIRVSHKFGGS